MVIQDAATFSGLMLACRIIGILQIRQKRKGKTERNNRLFAVPRRSHSERSLRDVRKLSKPFREELEKFFIATDELEDKKLDIIGWKGPKMALKAIKDAAKSFARRSSDFRRQNQSRSFSSRRPKQPWLAVCGTALVWMNARTVATL
jgi:inorganic pyrophosphatase